LKPARTLGPLARSRFAGRVHAEAKARARTGGCWVHSASGVQSRAGGGWTEPAARAAIPPALMPPALLDGVPQLLCWAPGRARAARPVTAWLPAAGLERLVGGVRVLRAGPGSRLVVSGWDAARSLSTAEVMETRGRRARVDPTRIVASTRRGTRREVAALHTLVGAQKVVIVTSGRHMPPRGAGDTSRTRCVAAPCERRERRSAESVVVDPLLRGARALVRGDPRAARGVSGQGSWS